MRAALPTELDYSTSEKESAEMTQILEVIISHYDDEIGEAAREFVLALATRKLQLRTADLQSLYDKHIKQSHDPIIAVLGQYMKDSLDLGTSGD
jgi:hypothetical protein